VVLPAVSFSSFEYIKGRTAFFLLF